MVVVAIVPPARAVWFDLKSRSEHLLDPGDHDPERPDRGFIWVDADLPAPEALKALTASGLLPAGIEIDDEAPGRVLWALGPDHLHLSLAVARLDGDALLLNRYSIVVTEGGVVSVHRGLPTHLALAESTLAVACPRAPHPFPTEAWMNRLRRAWRR